MCVFFTRLFQYSQTRFNVLHSLLNGSGVLLELVLQTSFDLMNVACTNLFQVVCCLDALLDFGRQCLFQLVNSDSQFCNTILLSFFANLKRNT